MGGGGGGGQEESDRGIERGGEREKRQPKEKLSFKSYFVRNSQMASNSLPPLPAISLVTSPPKSN